MEEEEKMMARTKFMKMCYKMPEAALNELVYNFVTCPMTLNICLFEVRTKTILGDEILKNLGYTND